MRTLPSALLVLLVLVGCNPPSAGSSISETFNKPELKGAWRAGDSEANWVLFHYYGENMGISFLGAKGDVVTDAKLVGQDLTIDTTRAQQKGVGFQEVPSMNGKYPVKVNLISKDEMELTDITGAFLGTVDPVRFQKITDSEADETSAKLMQRAMKMGG